MGLYTSENTKKRLAAQVAASLFSRQPTPIAYVCVKAPGVMYYEFIMEFIPT